MQDTESKDKTSQNSANTEKVKAESERNKNKLKVKKNKSNICLLINKIVYINFQCWLLHAYIF